MKKTVYVGMSGGVDSSTTAYLLQKQGYNVKGIYLKLHNKQSAHDFYIKRATHVADKLGIEFEVIDLKDSFKDKVYDYFVHSYKDGITPNPCAMCNREIKFGLLMDYALNSGAQYLATGHYIKTDGKYLYEGSEGKDQSYFLFYIKRDVIEKILFPLQDMEKKDVIALAKEKGFYPELDNYKESQEICFVETTYVDVLKRHMDVDKPGEVVDESGKVVGEHKGFMHYTIGKRKGFTVKGALEPHYVMDIDSKNNKIVVGKKGSMTTKLIQIKDVNLFENKTSFECDVKLRYRSKKVPCSVEVISDKAVIKLKDEVEKVAPGQAAVFYDSGKMIGGGWIVA